VYFYSSIYNAYQLGFLHHIRNRNINLLPSLAKGAFFSNSSLPTNRIQVHDEPAF
jgi:hypothetical protein